MNGTIDILRKSRAKLADPAHWTKGAAARDKTGFAAPSTSEDAVCWCAYGAIRSVCHTYLGAAGEEEEELHVALLALKSAFCGNVARFNDDPGTSHVDILAGFDRAIASLEG